MAGTIFWDVDTQVDFMRADGSLYVSGAETITSNLARLTQAARKARIRVIATADDHVQGHREISAQPDFQTTFPPHCMRGSPGQKKIAETALQDPLVIEPDPALARGALAQLVSRHSGEILLHKHAFDVFTNPNAATLLQILDPDRVTLYGVALDVCNRFAIEGLLKRRPELAIRVVQDACRAIDPARGEALLAEWSSRGVTIATTAQVLDSPS